MHITTFLNKEIPLLLEIVNVESREREESHNIRGKESKGMDDC